MNGGTFLHGTVLGWVGRPVLRKTSGNDAVDEKLSKLLTSKDLLKGLKSGQYRATFIP